MGLGTEVALISAALALVGAGLFWKAKSYPPAAGMAIVLLVALDTISHVLPFVVLLLIAAKVYSKYTGTASLVKRWAGRARRKSGVASSFDIFWRASWFAMRRQAHILRPSFASLPATKGLDSLAKLWTAITLTVVGCFLVPSGALYVLPAAACGILLGHLWRRGSGCPSMARRWRVWATTLSLVVGVPLHAFSIRLAQVGWFTLRQPIELVTLIFGGPRKGKSGLLMRIIIDAPGAVIATSTRTDLYDSTQGMRSLGGRPVYVFNAAGLGKLASTVTFPVLAGCTDPVVAMGRAEDMLSGQVGGGEREHWVAEAKRIFGIFLHAAALDRRPLGDVQRWISDTDRWHREITAALKKSSQPIYGPMVEQFLKTNDRTRTSVTNGLSPALAWLASPAAVAAASDLCPLDVEDLLRRRGTVYLLGAKETHTAPLLAGLTGLIAREARRLAASDSSVSSGRRLDPHLTLALDECALICPIPLDDWSADMGGRGVHIVACFQSRADIRAKWGVEGGKRIFNNSGAMVLFGGTNDEEDARLWSTRTGVRDELVGGQTRQVPVLTPQQIADLPPWRVVLFPSGMPCSLGKVKPAWKYRDYKRWMRHEAAATQAAVDSVIAAAERETELAESVPALSWSGAGVYRSGATVDEPVGPVPSQRSVDPRSNGRAGGSGE